MSASSLPVFLLPAGPDGQTELEAGAKKLRKSAAKALESLARVTLCAPLEPRRPAAPLAAKRRCPFLSSTAINVPVSFTQRRLLHLAHCVARQRLEEDDLFGGLELR